MKVLLRTVSAIGFCISLVSTAHASMRPFVIDNIKIFCSPLCTAGPDALIVESVGDMHAQHEFLLLSQLNSDVAELLLKGAAQENRSDVVERILKEFGYDFDLGVIHYLLSWAEVYEWPGRLVCVLEAKKSLLFESNRVPEGTRFDSD